MDPEMTPAESLKLIESMIAQTKRSFHRMSFYFLLWGVLLTVAMVVTMISAHQGWNVEGHAWLAVGVIGGLCSAIHGRREGRREQASTLAGHVLMWLWVAFMTTLIITLVCAGVAGYSTPVGAIMVLTGLPTFVTGQLVRFKPLILGGILFWVLGGITFFVDETWMAGLYIAAMLLGYITPGLMLKRQENALRTA